VSAESPTANYSWTYNDMVSISELVVSGSADGLDVEVR